MAVNARTEEFQHIEVFDKPALFTNGRIARDTVPKGWYCYDIRGSDDDPGALCYMEKNVVVNHAGSVLMPEKLAIPKSGRLDVRDELGFLDEGSMTLREFCEAHQLPYPTENMKFHIRPARPEEAGLFYTPHPEEDKRLGTVGHVRMDFGRSGNEFWHTWWPRGPEELNSPAFKLELQEVVDTLRESVLKNRFAMERFCYEHGGKISGGWTQNYGYIVETEHYRYCLRCNPSPGDYNCYCTAYDLDVQRQNMARDKPLVGRVTYAKEVYFQNVQAEIECLGDRSCFTEEQAGELLPIFQERLALYDVKRAAAYYLAIRGSFSGTINSFGVKGLDVERFLKLFPPVSARLKDVPLENKNALQLIRERDKKGSLIYADPPYVKTERLYRVAGKLGRFRRFHVRLWQVLTGRDSYVVLSYNDCPFIRKLYQDWYISSFQRSNPLSQKKGSSFGELIITNYDPRPYMTSQLNLFDEPLGEWELKLVHIPKYPPRRKTA